MKKEEKLKTIAAYAVAYLMVLIPRIIACLNVQSLRTLSDETSTINIAARCAGYDWSTAISGAGYYGIGTGILLSPFYRIFHDALTIYKASLIGIAVLESLVSIICLYILTQMLKLKLDWKTILISVTAGFLVVNRATVYYNEHMLILVCWLITLSLIKLAQNNDNKKQCFLWTLFLTFILGYSLTLHTRAILLFVAVIFAVLIYWLFYERWLVQIPCFLVSGAGFIFLARYVVKAYQKITWTEENVRNASVSLESAIPISLRDPVTWKAWLGIVCGQINMASIFSGGMIMAAAVMTIIFLWKGLVQKFIKKEAFDTSIWDQAILIIGIFGFAFIAMSIFGQSISWLDDAIGAIQGGVEGKVQGARAFTYTRYMAPAFGPIYMIVMAVLIQDEERFKKSYFISVVCTAIFHAYWLVYLLPYCYRVTGCAILFAPFSPDKSLANGLVVFLPFTIVITVLTIIFVIFLRKGWGKYLLPILAVFVTFEYCSDMFSLDMDKQKENAVLADAAEELYQSVRQGQPEVLPDDIYVMDLRAVTDHQIYYLYQFHMFDKKVIPVYPDKDVEEAVLFTNSNDLPVHYIYSQYMEVQLDDNEYIWIKGEELQQELLPYIRKQMAATKRVNLKGASSYGVSLDADVKEVSSNGQAGNLLTTDLIVLPGGELELSVKLSANSIQTEEVGSVRVTSENSGRILAAYDITSADFSEQESAEIILQMDSYHIEDAVITIDSTADNLWTMQGIHYKVLSEVNYVGAGVEHELRSLKTIMERIDDNLPIYLMSGYDRGTYTFNLSKIQETFGRKIEYLSCKDYEAEKYQKPGYLLLCNDDDYQWTYALTENYVILGQAGGYTLAVSKTENIQNKIQELGLETYSSDAGVDLRFFNLDSSLEQELTNEAEIVLYQGEYEFTVKADSIQPSGYDTDLVTLLGRTLYHEYNLDEAKAKDGSVYSVCRMQLYRGSEKVTLGTKIAQGTLLEGLRIYVKKSSDELHLDLSTLNRTNAKLTDDGIEITGAGSFNVYGPYLQFASGDYQVNFVYELMEGSAEGKIGSVDIGRNGMQMPNTAREIDTDDFQDGRLTVTIPFTVVNYQNVYEFRTIVGEGGLLRLSSITFERIEE